jgi:chromosome segregation ATPase
MDETFEQILEELKAKGEALGHAYGREQELEDDRAAVKADAIQRIIKRDNIAATPAEKIVETDEGYYRHRVEQRASIVERFRADAAYKAAAAKATRASLMTPALVELKGMINEIEGELHRANLANRELTEISNTKEGIIVRLRGEMTTLETQRGDLSTQVAQLSTELGQAKRTIDQKEIARRRANGFLADRISDVDRLKETIAKLRAENDGLRKGLDVPPTLDPPPAEGYFDTLPQARDFVASESKS